MHKRATVNKPRAASESTGDGKVEVAVKRIRRRREKGADKRSSASFRHAIEVDAGARHAASARAARRRAEQDGLEDVGDSADWLDAEREAAQWLDERTS